METQHRRERYADPVSVLGTLTCQTLRPAACPQGSVCAAWTIPWGPAVPTARTGTMGTPSPSKTVRVSVHCLSVSLYLSLSLPLSLILSLWEHLRMWVRFDVNLSLLMIAFSLYLWSVWFCIMWPGVRVMSMSTQCGGSRLWQVQGQSVWIIENLHKTSLAIQETMTLWK